MPIKLPSSIVFILFKFFLLRRTPTPSSLSHPCANLEPYENQTVETNLDKLLQYNENIFDKTILNTIDETIVKIK